MPISIAIPGLLPLSPLFFGGGGGFFPGSTRGVFCLGGGFCPSFWAATAKLKPAISINVSNICFKTFILSSPFSSITLGENGKARSGFIIGKPDATYQNKTSDPLF